MPVYTYKGFDARGRAVANVKDADNPKALRALLRRDGVMLTEVREGAQRGGKTSAKDFQPKQMMRQFRERESADRGEVATITRQLGTLLKAGVPLAESLAALVEQVERPGLKRVLADVRTQVNEGSSLGDAMARHGQIFEDLYVNMIRAGEAAGNLDAVLFRLADFLDAQNRLRGKITSAMFYPIVMALVGCGLVGLLMVSVVPKVTEIYAESGKADLLPWNTKLMIFSASFFANYWWTLIFIIPAVVVMFRRWKATVVGRALIDKWTLKMPIIGPLARMIAITRFSKTLSTMLSAGVPLLRALDIVKSILGNVVLTKVIEDAKESIKEGESIAAPLKRSGEFPPIVTHMIAVGERSGQLETMLENVAAAYDQEVDMKIGRLTTLLEPMMILLMGGSVGFVVMSILSPIMEMNQFVN
ncbi:MAG: type II secretion system inner membrane protein GspF [Polyangia bacterium]